MSFPNTTPHRLDLFSLFFPVLTFKPHINDKGEFCVDCAVKREGGDDNE